MRCLRERGDLLRTQVKAATMTFNNAHRSRRAVDEMKEVSGADDRT